MYFHVLPALGMCYSDSTLYNVLFLITGIFIHTQRTQFHILMFPPS